MMYLVVFASTMAVCIAEGSELRKFAKGYVRPPHRHWLGVDHIPEDVKASAPDAVDWVVKGATTPVKDQGECGDCWAFATTEGIESAVFMATGTLKGLSEQQITSCVKDANGCKGGDPAPALDYVKANGIDSQSDYPDTSPDSGETGKCAWNGNVAAKVTGYRYAIPVCDSGPCDGQDEDALAAAVAKYGPLTICINAGPWNNSEGWTTNDVVDFGDTCSSAADKMDHCVQLVGYDKTASTPYWKIRNTWTENWGEHGFIRLPYGKNACGLANEVYIIEASTSQLTSEPRQFAKGYIREPRRHLLGVEHISEDVKASAPDAVDWVAKGATTPVKDQGECGDCWAFATTEGIESAVFMATGALKGLSEQQITSCVKGANGCKGGDPAPALDYVKANGIDSQSDYPDTSPDSGETGKCAWNGNVAAKVTGYRFAIPVCDSGPCDGQDEDALAAAVAKYGPLTICINAGPWNNSEGWTTNDVVDFGDNCSSAADKMDHCVQLVGYDKTASVPYWKIRNTWTENWGEHGFIRLPYGKNACGLANEVYIIEATAAGTNAIIV